MREPRTAAIVGLGLMGGSLARDLASRGTRVVAYDRDPTVLADARGGKVVAESLDADLAGATHADLVVLALPGDRALEALDRLAGVLSGDALITDMGSTKRSIVAKAETLGLADRFVGSHPLAGDHRSGWAAGRQGLFRGVPVFVCPSARSRPTSVERVEAMWRSVGAFPERIDATSHDHRMAWISHLPQIAASAVAMALRDAGRLPTELGPGGRDVTRLAGSSPEMWTAICLENADLILPALQGLRHSLSSFTDALSSSDPARLEEFFRSGRDWLADPSGTGIPGRF